MPSERMQRRIDAFLDQAEDASDAGDWQQVAEKARAALAIDPSSEDAATFLEMAVANGVAAEATTRVGKRTAVSVEEPARSVVEAAAIVEELEAAHATPESDPESFAGGRYRVLRFLGEGGKKRVFLAHDALLDRDVAFSLIKTDGLDDVGRQRITREAQAMGRLTHQHIVSVYDIGEHTSLDGTKQPYLVQELMGGGDVEGLLAEAAGPLPLRRALDITIATARGLEFAHAQGVIHRDLKPGNVWLTADGVAKIGDLGLAVTLGQTRLTEHGMMVGTYGYMPPEQALGQEVTAQADLYSLGAMLYELVTGHPPFQGDSPTAVISQHLNTQPVAPSWHSDHCPPDLEDLILRLLAKAPADRPTSATEVIAALEAVDPEGVSASHSTSAVNPLDRLARGVFVGRRDELGQLRRAFDAVLDGRGGVVMLAGEPGIGKTRTVQELETYARMRGASVYWGRAHESSGMPAYWPWIQIGRAWGAQRDLAASEAIVGLNPELTRLFPELRQFVPGLPELAPSDDPESAQFLLFDAYTQFMRAQAAERPWVIVLDDLHWADKPTLQLLAFVARELANMNVLVVGTYRDTDLVRTHPLSEALAELAREGGFQRIPLKGLTRDEVAAYVRQSASVDPDRGVLDRIFEETEGNPFFLSEIVNIMTQEGDLASAGAEIALPEGVREALGRRLDRLSEEANQLLQVAAVVGREFAYDTLALLAEHDDDRLLQLIEEALRAGVISESERAGRYSFTHALMQETLLAELTTTRTVRLHGRIAEVLERRFGDRADQRASLLAQHFFESATLTAAHAEKAVRYLELAAQAAEANSAWATAAQQFEQAANLVDENELEPSNRRLEFLLAAARAHRLAEEPRGAWSCLMQSAELARSSLDGTALARVAAEVATAYLAPPARSAALAREALELLSDEAPALRAELLARAAGANHFEPGSPELAEAMALDRQLLSERARGYLLTADAARAAFKEGSYEEAVMLLSSAATMLEAAGDGESAAIIRNRRLEGLHILGDFVQIEEELPELTEFCTRRNLRFPLRIARGIYTRTLVLRSDYDLVRKTLASPLAEGMIYSSLSSAELHLFRGEIAEASEALWTDRQAGFDPYYLAVTIALRARIQLAGGDAHRALETVERWVSMAGEFDRALPLAPTAADEALSLLSEETRLTIYRRFAAHLRNSDARFFETGSVNRVAGELALSLGRLNEAEAQLRRAIDACEEFGCPVELGRSHAALASVSEAKGDADGARELLDRAGELLSKHSARLYLDQVIAKKEILKA